MKTLTLPLVILLAIALLVWLLLRRRHDRTLVLRGRFSHRVVRTAAILLLLLGLSPAQAVDEPRQRSAESQHDADDGALKITPDVIDRWRRVPDYLAHHFGSRFKVRYITLRDRPHLVNAAAINALIRHYEFRPPQSPLAALVWSDLEARLRGDEPAQPDDQNLLDAAKWLDEAALYDSWFVAYIWKRSGELPPPEGEQQRLVRQELFERLARTARITNALVLAHAEVKPVPFSPRPWMSKAGPRPELVQHWREDNEAIHRAVQRIYPTVDIGTWASDGGVMLTLADDMPAVTLIRAGEQVKIKPGETFAFQRLDLVETPEADQPMIVHHEWLGQIALPQNELLSVWTVSLRLSPEQKEKAQGVVERAAEEGDEESMTQLERSLPLVWTILAREAKRLDDDAGARVRTLLALFDDTLTTASILDVPQDQW